MVVRPQTRRRDAALDRRFVRPRDPDAKPHEMPGHAHRAPLGARSRVATRNPEDASHGPSATTSASRGVSARAFGHRKALCVGRRALRRALRRGRHPRRHRTRAGTRHLQVREIGRSGSAPELRACALAAVGRFDDALDVLATLSDSARSSASLAIAIEAGSKRPDVTRVLLREAVERLRRRHTRAAREQCAELERKLRDIETRAVVPAS
jgi:hypothetical protein